MSFPVTAGEWDFAREHEDTYYILRVLRVGKPDMTVIIIIGINILDTHFFIFSFDIFSPFI